MVHFSLINMKENKKTKIFGIITYEPTNNNSNEYKIIIKSNKSEYIQFKFYEKLMNYVKFKHNKISYKYYLIPTDGMLISCILSNENPLEIILKPKDLCSKITIVKFKKNIPQELKLINIFWDNIFIINLPRRTDRQESMKKKLSQANITRYEFIEASDGSDLNIQEKYLTHKTKTNTNIITSGHFACLLSHIASIKLAKERKYSSIMILEDDVYFCKDFLNKLTNLLVPQYDMLYLGGIVSKKKLFFNDWATHDKIMGAYGYILNNSLYNVVLDQLEKLTEYVDVFYLKHIQPNYSVVLLNDYIKTDLASSDTSHKCNKLVKRLEYIG